ncbi:uncharacterized protein LOC122079495 isoform X1 [Macadamia integrifolia]|uniref:uncharacterized protein LOC122079495 isoform X1 n=1 Tax=Macadamia integrifolia TaxID=60698 RepID=UPI001C4EB3B2|nr:uncharacterized protein LOC122079495 isoform X1 [Macadamia integrifolia]XP_042501946.1 uncharacterized protein LOC122079495 isoform X1 [Macadamia integrifolia]XP_042501947.1 uncharacterized protein LOC122079495 isoform X1 [Macadamia integrifolia]XP_042501948.1 uncharacterized protein LOC122079495 isoform X1 [Macadamia integrifolia]
MIAKKSVKYRKDSHTNSVLGLAWKKEFRNVLASASVDNTVKIWDVATGKCDITMEHHTDKFGFPEVGGVCTEKPTIYGFKQLHGIIMCHKFFLVDLLITQLSCILTVEAKMTYRPPMLYMCYVKWLVPK